VQEERAVREHVFVSRFAGRIPPGKGAEVCSGSAYIFPAEPSRSHTQIEASHHRDFDAGAVLGVVNALRCASTRPTAGPPGIDDASARHVFGNYAMVGNLSITRRSIEEGHSKRVLTRESR
jgi:hypothetical protein